MLRSLSLSLCHWLGDTTLEAPQIIQPNIAPVPLKISISNLFTPGIILKSSNPRLRERREGPGCSVMAAISHVGLCHREVVEGVAGAGSLYSRTPNGFEQALSEYSSAMHCWHCKPSDSRDTLTLLIKGLKPSVLFDFQSFFSVQLMYFFLFLTISLRDRC